MRRLVLLSLDAFFDHDLTYFGEDSWLQTWMKHAAVCTQVKTVFPALTYPAHTTLITGCTPAEHGVGHNQPFQPDIPAESRRWYWKTSDIRRETLPQAVHRQGGRCASILWPVSGKCRESRWNFPEVLALPGENQLLKMLDYGSTGWIIRMEMMHGRQRVSIHEPHLSDYGAILACDVIRRHQPELTALHMVDLDEQRHLHGVDSPEAIAALKRMEQRVRQVWETMQATPGMEDALLVLVSDHGQVDVEKRVCLTDALNAAGLNGCVRVQTSDLTAFLYEGSLGAEGVAKAAAFLRAQGEILGVKCVHDRAMLDQLGAMDGPALAVEAAPGVVFTDGHPAGKIVKGTHGFGVNHPAENCLLAVRGRGIREGVMLPSMPMRDVAPTLAGLMGISLPESTGKDHSQELMMG